MYIYRGKLDFSPSQSQTATNEGITIIFPSEFRLGDPVYTCWQWSTSDDKTNIPCWLTGAINLVANFDTGKKIGYSGGSDCRFDTTRLYPSNLVMSNLLQVRWLLLILKWRRGAFDHSSIRECTWHRKQYQARLQTGLGVCQSRCYSPPYLPWQARQLGTTAHQLRP